MKKRALCLFAVMFVVLLPVVGYAADQSYVLKLSHTQSDTAPIVRALVVMAKDLETRTGGRLKAEVYPNGMLGDTQEMVAQCLSGSNVGFMTDAGRFSNFLPEIGILNAPYFFETYEEGNKLVQTDMFKGWTDQLGKEGYRLLSFNWYEGGRHLITNKDIKTMADVKDLKIRTGATPEWIATLNAFGCKPTALPQSEVYQGIQQKIVDGADQQIITVYGMQLFEIAKYYTMTNHYQLMLGLCVSDKWFQTLPEDLKQILIEESFKAGEYASQLTLNDVGRMMDEMQAKGLVVNEIDLTEFRAAGETVYDEFPSFKENRVKLYQLIGKN